jgi:predicted ferric reductase
MKSLSSPFCLLPYIVLLLLCLQFGCSTETSSSFLTSTSLSVSSSTPNTLSSSSSPVLQNPDACLNSCSNRGQCSSNNTCICDPGRLGVDCSIQSLMDPGTVCLNNPSSGSHCVYWRILDQNIYIRMVVNPNNGSTPNGYGAILFNSTNGMSGGTGHIVRMVSDYSAIVDDVYSTGYGQITVLTSSIVVSSNITAFRNASFMDVSFVRPLFAGTAFRANISSVIGSQTVLSIAFGSVYLHSHGHGNARYQSYDLVALSNANVCPNSCSNQGVCSSNSTCICNPGWLDVDCSLQSFMSPLCTTVNNANYCSYWRIQNNRIYQRIQADVAANGNGWAGVMWNATADGMTNGTGLMIQMAATYYPIISDIYATRRGAPTILDTVSVTREYITGFVNGSSIDVSFSRPLDTGLANHAILPSTTGVNTRVSFAWNNGSFGFHNRQAVTATYDLVQISSNNGSNTNQSCPNNCGNQGVCSSNGMCMCNTGRLGADCSIESKMEPECFTVSSNTMCLQWLIRDEIIYFRVSTTFNGWSGILFGTSDGMGNGEGFIMQPEIAPYVGEYYSTAKGASPQPMVPSFVQNISTWSVPSGTGREYIFQRRCNVTTGSQDGYFAFATVAGTEVLVSYGFSPNSPTLSYHDRNRGMFKADMAAGSTNTIDFDVATLYIPVLVAFGVVIIFGILFQVPKMYRSTIGQFFLRKRLQSLFASSNAVAQRSANHDVQSGRRGTAILNMLTYDSLFTIRDMTFGELSVVLAYMISVIVMCTVGRQQLTDAARDPNLIFAHVAAFHLALTLFPVTHNSIWLPLFGISFERAIKFHRLIARATLGFILGHGINRIQAYGSTDILFKSDALPYGNGAIYGSLACLCIILMAVTAIGPIRRFAFEFFYFLHIPLFISAVVFACLHSLYVRYYLIAPLSLYGIDHVMRFFSSARPATIQGMNVYEDSRSIANGVSAGSRVTELVINAKNFKYTPGQYVFLNVPKLSPLQWHPFSISYVDEHAQSAEHFVPPHHVDDTLSSRKDLIGLHILDAGKGTWTHELSQLVRNTMGTSSTFDENTTVSLHLHSSDGTLRDRIPIYIDGPYGSLSIPLHEYTSVVLIAGGIGITPFASIINDILHRMDTNATRIQYVTLVWTSRHLTYFSELFPSLLVRMAARQDCKIFLTCTTHLSDLPIPARGKFVSDSAGTSGAIQFILDQTILPIPITRPNLFTILRGAGENTSPSSVGVLVCGPVSLSQSAQKYSMQLGYHLHKETFLL